MIELTPWFSCSTPPSRDGWYDVMRVILGLEQPAERVRYWEGKWDIDACESRVAVWRDQDYWRGVTEGGAKS